MKIRFYFAQTEADETRKEYIQRYNMHEGIVTTVNPEAAPVFDFSFPGRAHAANVFQTVMQLMNPTQNPVQFEVLPPQLKPLNIQPTTDEQLQDIIGLVLKTPVPLDVIQTWTDPERTAVLDWCGAMHFAASDNTDVDIPPVPDVLKPFGAYDISVFPKSAE